MRLFAKAVWAESDDSPSNWACVECPTELAEHGEGAPTVSLVASDRLRFMGVFRELFCGDELLVVSRLSSLTI
jgi:hypothetical protein